MIRGPKDWNNYVNMLQSPLLIPLEVVLILQMRKTSGLTVVLKIGKKVRIQIQKAMLPEPASLQKEASVRSMLLLYMKHILVYEVYILEILKFH